MNILLTGSSGFIGSEIKFQILKRGHTVRSIYDTSKINDKNSFQLKISPYTNWSKQLKNIECIIHCAAKTHLIKKKFKSDINQFREINVKATKNLAEQASINGVKRFIFLSSIKVNGEMTDNHNFFKWNDKPKPEDPYGISKYEAENVLREISEKTGLEVVIIRPSLVYGVKVKGNFLRLLDIIQKGIPLPFDKLENLRSYVGLDNLVDLILNCINHPKASGKILLVSDGEDISTSNLIRKISNYMMINPRLFKLPTHTINLFASLLGKRSEIQKLIGSLRVDNSETCKLLNWKPIITLDQGINKVTQWYLNK